MLKGKRIGFVGGGNMAEALVRGLLQSGQTKASDLIASDVIDERLKLLERTFGIRTTTDNREVVSTSDLFILAVKPQIMAEVLDGIAPKVGGDKLAISIAAGVPLGTLEAHLGAKARVIRVMPNNCALIGESASALAPNRMATAADLAVARAIFDAVGKTVVVEEKLMDAVTGLSGSGPAYVYAVIEALADGGVLMGLPRDVALTLTAQTVLGAAKAVLETREPPAVLKERVTSPGGTTIAGLYAMERAGLRGALMAGVEAATRRSMELGAAAAPKA